MKELFNELETNLLIGNYCFLEKTKKKPQVAGCFLKKVLKHMGEPLCTLELYENFRSIQSNKFKIILNLGTDKTVI